MGNYIDSKTLAENAGGVNLSAEKFSQVRDKVLKLFLAKKWRYNSNFQCINDCISNGDTQPAIVHSVSPLIISAYSDEMDGVVFLEFPEKLTEMYNLYEGMRLVTSNVYNCGFKIAKDINIGKDYLKRYTDFTPIVQLFLAEDENYIMSRTELFDEEVWDRVKHLTEEYAHSGKKARKGFYYFTKVRNDEIFCIFCLMAGVVIAFLAN